MNKETKLENLSITAVINGEPVLIAMSEEQCSIMATVLLPSLFGGAIKVLKLDKDVHKLGTMTFAK